MGPETWRELKQQEHRSAFEKCLLKTLLAGKQRTDVRRSKYASLKLPHHSIEYSTSALSRLLCANDSRDTISAISGPTTLETP